MNAMRNKKRRHLGMWGVAAVAVGGLLGADAASAGQVRTLGGRHGQRVRVPPVYETRARTVVVPAVYETRPVRIWHEPVYETRRVFVEMPAKVVTRRVRRYDGFEVVKEVVRPARRVWKRERLLVEAGYYETAYRRVCVQPETTRVVHQEVLVSPGHRAHPKAMKVRKLHDRHRFVGARRPHRSHDRGLHVAVRLGD